MRPRFVGGMGAPVSTLRAVGRGGEENEPAEEGGVPVEAVSPAAGCGPARRSDAGAN